tara:strand:- start:655 stop:1656 length:1002 start_codon:yes stop_codon:yes gene_type:complete
MIPDIGNVNVNAVVVPNVGVGVVEAGSAIGLNVVGNVDVSNVRTTDVNSVDVQDVNNIGVDGARIADTRIWTTAPPNVQQLDPPVVVQVGTPIVNIAGCVEVHKENARTRNRNKQLVDNDPKGNTVLCDSGAPNFIPPDYQANRLTWQTFYGEQPQADGVKTKPPPPPNTPDTPEPPPAGGGDAKEDPPCPGPVAPRIGDVAQNQTEKVSGFELQRDPRNPDGVKICVTLYEDIGSVEAFLPAPQMVTTTAVIATVATGSALLAKPLADLLLKVVKPVVKKAMGTIQKKLGKTPYRPTQSEIRANQYREKKGMLPLNFAKRGKKMVPKPPEKK